MLFPPTTKLLDAIAPEYVVVAMIFPFTYNVINPDVFLETRIYKISPELYEYAAYAYTLTALNWIPSGVKNIHHPLYTPEL